MSSLFPFWANSTPEEIAARRVRLRAVATDRRPKLTADERLVLEWYRESVRLAASEDPEVKYHTGAVRVLLVGNPGIVGTINHQLDHIGGGLASLSHGVEVSHCVAPDPLDGPECQWSPRRHVEVCAIANGLGAHGIMSPGEMHSPYRGLAALEKEGHE